ncbi:MAG TPA: hypothetical protein VFE18_03280 [Phenylobacterium sp.]|jgi:hypothetical protein|uniref:hypothetical protein n=1 Tax=Phenylobacterium sp. TaxID=1871053 RepID=UPI002D3D8259|nr:hypothetical protein [Phenylobacterium sp.]HZZ67174.1 hypothetical protein [Phenylobacterium sp.]
MTDQDALRDDIAFMRSLAEEGRNGPLLGGAIMMAGGLLFGLASLVLYLGLASGMSIDSRIELVWPISGVLFFVALFILLRRMPRAKGALARGVGVGWSAAGWTMFTLVVALCVMAVRLDDTKLTAVFPPAILALYGCSWFIAAGAARRSWLTSVTVGSFVMAVVTAWFALQPIDYLIYAISLFVLVAAPGFVLTRQARKAAA